jgi:death-on-curing protein
MTEPCWLSRLQVEAIHDEQLHEHGGRAGLLDPGGLEAALARPLNIYLHAKCDLADLAAAYARGIVKNHPFNDGNKRTAFAVAAVFLDINRVEITMSEQEAVLSMIELTGSSITEKQFAEFLRKNSRKLKRR